MVLLSAFVVLLTYFVIRRLTIGHFIGGYGTQHHLAILQTKTLLNLASDVLRSVVPAIPRVTCNFVEQPASLAFLAVGSGFIGLLLYRARKRFAGAQGLLIVMLALAFIVSLLPVVTMDISVVNTEGERLVYLPSAFTAAIFAMALPLLFRRTGVVVAIAAFCIVVESATLCRVNHRWITAAQMTKAIARQISRYDPSTTAIVNLPDNYRGAYVFRTGLFDAATTFEGKKADIRYQILCTHDVHSLTDIFDVSCEGAKFRFSPSEGRKVRMLNPASEPVQWIGDGFVAALPSRDGQAPCDVLSYRQGSPETNIRTIDVPMPRRNALRTSANSR